MIHQNSSGMGNGISGSDKHNYLGTRPHKRQPTRLGLGPANSRAENISRLTHTVTPECSRSLVEPVGEISVQPFGKFSRLRHDK